MDAPNPPNPLDSLLSGAKQLTDLQLVYNSVLERIHAEFGALLNTSVAVNDADRKRHALAYLHSARQQLLRLVALVQWHPKAKALLPCVQPNQVLDTARRHAQLLEAAAVEMYEAHMRRQPDFSPMFDINTALDVLSTGNYAYLPSSIEKLGKGSQPSPEQQARRLRHITHIIHSQLLKANLPAGCEVVQVEGGSATLRMPGLYEAKLTVVPGTVLPQETQATTSADDVKQEGIEQATGVAATSMEVDEEEISSGRPATRWRWLLLEFCFPVNSLKGSVLQDAQMRNLLRDLNNRMHVAADAAVYEQRRRQKAADEAVHVAPNQPGVSHAGSAQPAASQQMSVSHTTTTGARSNLTGHTEQLNRQRHIKHNLALLEQCAADDVASPLAVMHCVLCDIAGRILVDAARTVAQQLVSPGGCWAGHATLEPGASALGLGFTVSFWTKAVLLLPQPLQPVTAAPTSTSRAPMQPPANRQLKADSLSNRPVLEIGVAADGSVKVLTNVSFENRGTDTQKLIQVASSAQLQSMSQDGLATPSVAAASGSEQGGAAKQNPSQQALQLNASTVNVDELMLLAASTLARQELSLLADQLRKELTNMAIPGNAWQLKLTASTMQSLPASARPLVDALTVQQAASGLSAVSASAAANAHQSRALHHHNQLHPGSSSFIQPLTSLTDKQGPGHITHDNKSDLVSKVSGTIQFPLLEFWSQNELLVCISRSLYTGRLLLQPGPGLAGDAHLQSLLNWSQREDDINSLLVKLSQQPGGIGGSSGGKESSLPATSTSPATSFTASLRILHEVGHRLATLLREQQRTAAVSLCMTTARQLHLHLGSPSTRIISAFHAENPWADIKKLYTTLWSLPPTPFPANFPAIFPSQPGTPNSLIPRNVNFVLGADHPTNPRASYALFVVACSAQMLPLRVLKLVPIPSHIYATKPRDNQEANGCCRPGVSNISGQYPGLTNVSGDQNSSRVGGGNDMMEVDGVPTGNGQPGGRSASRRNGAGGHTSGRAGDESGAGPSRDLHAELTSVMAWCRQRLVWEKLLVQLQALQVKYMEMGVPKQETSNNSTQERSTTACCRIELTSFNSIRIPCRFARRKGLKPGRVGIRHVSFTCGSDWHDERIVMEVQGSWFCIRPGAHSPAYRNHVPNPTTNSNNNLTAYSNHIGDHHAHSNANANRSASSLASSNSGLKAISSQQDDKQGIIRLEYSLAQGQSALDMFADLLCIIRMQMFLARLERLAIGSQALQVVPVLADNLTTGSGMLKTDAAIADGDAALGIKRSDSDLCCSLDQHPNKRRRGPDNAPVLPMENGHHVDHQLSNGHVGLGKVQTHSHAADKSNKSAASKQQQSSLLVHDHTLSWSWPPNASVTLVSYDPTSAVLMSHQGSDGVNSTLTDASLFTQPIYPIKHEPSSLQPVNSHTTPTSLAFKVRWLPNLPSTPTDSDSKPYSNTTDGKKAAVPPQKNARSTPDIPGGITTSIASNQQQGSSQLSDSNLPQHSTPQPPTIDIRKLARCSISMTIEEHTVGPGSTQKAFSQQIGVDSAWGSSRDSAEMESSLAPTSSLVHSFLYSLQDIADSGEEALLLDAITVSSQPTAAVHSVVESWKYNKQASVQGLMIVHTPDHAPFQHEMVVGPIKLDPTNTINTHTSIGAFSSTQSSVSMTTIVQADQNRSQPFLCMTVRVNCLAINRSWLHITCQSQASNATIGAAPAYLATILRQLRDQLGEESVYVASAWSNLAGMASGPTAGSFQTKPQLWVLVHNSHLAQAVQVLLSCACAT